MFFAEVEKMTGRRSHIIASIMLIGAAFIWGVSFVMMKNSLDAMPPNLILAIRFSVGALGLSFALIKYRRELSWRVVAYGALTGFFLYAGFTSQTYGLQYTTVGKNAFITGVYVVIVPVFAWLILKKRPKPMLVIAALLCFAGLGLVSLGGETGAAAEKSLSIFGATLSGGSLELFGDGLTLVSGIFFALHIVFVDKYAEKNVNMLVLTCLQFTFCAIYSWTNTLLTETMPSFATLPTSVWLSIAYVALLATLLAQTLQNIGIKNAQSSYASLLLCLEAPFGSLAAIVILHEKPTISTIIGFVVICAAMVLAQLEPKKKTSQAL